MGTCQVIPQFLTQGTIELTWYGRALRRSDLTVVVDQNPLGAPLCPPAVCAILVAINVYTPAVLGLQPLPELPAQCASPS